MIAGPTNAARGVSLATARFDRAAQQVATAGAEAAQSEGGDAGAAATAAAAVGVGLPDAMVQMATARFALLASLRAAAATNTMVAEAIALGGYDGAPPRAA